MKYADTKWILFAKRPSRDNCIGKGRILDCRLLDNGSELFINMTLDGVRFVGTLAPAHKQEDECCLDECCGCGNHECCPQQQKTTEER